MNWLIHWLPEIAAAVLAILTLYKSGKMAHRKWISPCVEFVKVTRSLAQKSASLLSLDAQLAEQAKRLSEFQQTMERILRELQPNGGSTLADLLTQLVAQVTVNATRQRLLLNEDERPMFYSDERGLTVHVTQAYADLVNRSPDSILRDGWKTHLAERCRAQVSSEWAAAVAEEREFQMEMEMVNTRERKRLSVEVTAYPAKTWKGKLIGYVGILNVIQTTADIRNTGSRPGFTEQSL